MTDAEVEELLRSDAPIVVIEAPAGCGKTYQAANYAEHAAKQLNIGQVLVLTHTHAACSVIAERTKEIKKKVRIQTLDSLINQIASMYRKTLGLPEDVADWARHNGYETLAEKVSLLMCVNPMLCKHVTKLYPIIICDEHQDSSEHQDKIVRAISKQGAFLRIFGDPIQIIGGGSNQKKLAGEALARWRKLLTTSKFGHLETPHRWLNSSPELGLWIQQARISLEKNGFIDLESQRPLGLNITMAENVSPSAQRYLLRPNNSKELSSSIENGQTALYIAGKKATVEHIHSYFGRRFPIWEGHTRPALESFIDLVTCDIELHKKVNGYLDFLNKILTGFTRSKYGKRLDEEVKSLHFNPRGDIPPELHYMAIMIIKNPNHIGFAQATSHLKTLIINKAKGFDAIHIKYPTELTDLIKLKSFSDAKQGYADLSQRRSRAHPKPPSKAASTIHKSKGLEAESVVIFGCDANHFGNSQTKKNLLYVALSRPTHTLTLVLSRDNPSPLIKYNG